MFRALFHKNNNVNANPYIDNTLVDITPKFRKTKGKGTDFLRGNAEDSQKLLTCYMRKESELLQRHIPMCIVSLCYAFFFEPTNVTFGGLDPRMESNVNVLQNGKRVKISSRTVFFLLNDDGFKNSHHIWHIKCHRVYNCQAVGIVEKNNMKYRYGDNIYDTSLNLQLGDRYIYAGDIGTSWRGNVDQPRPYVFSCIGKEHYYSKKLALANNEWQEGDIITVDLDMRGKKWTITFLKNGEALHEPIRIVKKCTYYPIFQQYSRGDFEIIDDIDTELAMQKATKKEPKSVHEY